MLGERKAIVAVIRGSHSLGGGDRSEEDLDLYPSHYEYKRNDPHELFFPLGTSRQSPHGPLLETLEEFRTPMPIAPR